MALPKKKGFIQEVAKPKQEEFLQEVIEPEIQTPVEPELLQEIVEEAPAEEEAPVATRTTIRSR